MNDEKLMECYDKCLEYCKMIKNPILKETAPREYYKSLNPYYNKEKNI